MSGTWTFNDVQVIAVLAGLAVTWGGVAVAWGVNKAKIAENATRLDQQQARLDKIEREQSEFRERVAREFVAREHVRELEDRFLLAMDRLGKQIDTLSDRLDRVLVQATKPPRGLNS